ncbi:hypothetical protein [Paenibacillus sp. CAA11]|uniref:hypothetical protein n=1 Tax=Paenibacillus sp. CAA11 TaxID=1532905 RepID=UPI00131EE249|nr:hypothetical protein [Paenibacillus sp. CAA11]
MIFVKEFLVTLRQSKKQSLWYGTVHTAPGHYRDAEAWRRGSGEEQWVYLAAKSREAADEPLCRRTYIRTNM